MNKFINNNSNTNSSGPSSNNNSGYMSDESNPRKTMSKKDIERELFETIGTTLLLQLYSYYLIESVTSKEMPDKLYGDFKTVGSGYAV